MCKGVALRIQLQIWTQERSVTSCCHPPYVVSFTLSALTSVSHSLRRTSPEQKTGPFHTLQYSFADYDVHMADTVHNKKKVSMGLCGGGVQNENKQNIKHKEI